MNSYEKYILILPFLIIAFILSFFLTPIIGFIATRLGIVDKPKALREDGDESAERRIHKTTVPKLGGLASSIPILILLPFYKSIDLQVAGIIICLVIVMIAGFMDDKKELSSKKQLLVFFILPLITVLSGTIITGNLFEGFLNANVGGPFYLTIFGTNITLYIFSVILTFLWIIGISYSVKVIDGVDGVLTGISAIATLIIMLVSIREGSALSAFIGAIFLGGLLGFFPYNFYPAKIFNGCGDIINGYLIAVLAITSQVKLSVLLLILLLPVMDFAIVVWGRSKRRKPKSVQDYFSLITTGDKTHLHHRLLEAGLNFKQVAYAEYFIATIVGLMAFLLSGLNLTLAIFSTFTIILLTFYIVRRKMLFERVEQTQEKIATKITSKKPKHPYEY